MVFSGWFWYKVIWQIAAARRMKTAMPAVFVTIITPICNLPAYEPS